MKKINLSELNNHISEEIVLFGFVDKVRDLQYVQFIILRDRTGIVQITVEKNNDFSKLNEIVKKLKIDSVLKVYGKVLVNEKVKLGGIEVIPSNIEILSEPVSEMPFYYKDLNGVNLDTRLDYRYLDLRNERNNLIFQIQSCFVKAMRNYLENNDFIEIHTPRLIGSASESGSEVFEVKYFDDKAYLAQSPQFYKQMAMAAGFEKIYEIGPVFRAENSNTNRHATEYTSFDLELSYIDSYLDVMDLEEDLLIAGLQEVKNRYGEVIKSKFGVEVIVPKKPFPRIKLQDLYQELEKRYGYHIPEEDIGDMNAETEKLTSRYATEEYGHEFIFVTDFAKTKRAFYHMRKNDIPQGYDLLWRGMEITTGAQREHRYDILVEQAREKGLGKDVQYYLEFFKYGCPPHGGFAIGIDRITMLLLGLSTLKESMLLFRGPSRLIP